MRNVRSDRRLGNAMQQKSQNQLDIYPFFLGISPEIYGHMHSILTAEPIADLR